jgi:hypothetical protein
VPSGTFSVAGHYLAAELAASTPGVRAMACVLNAAFWVYLIVMIAGIMIVRIVIPWVVAFFQFPEPIPQIVSIVLWAVIACMGVYFLFGLLSCLFSSGAGLSFPTFPHPR